MHGYSFSASTIGVMARHARGYFAFHYAAPKNFGTPFWIGLGLHLTRFGVLLRKTHRHIPEVLVENNPHLVAHFFGIVRRAFTIPN